MSIYTGNQKLKKLYIGNQAVRKAYLGNQLVYSAGNIVTYHVDAGVRYQEEVGEGESCLSPKTFTPQKAGWAFVGWRTDATASGDVISSLIMGDSPIELYAVFTHPVTVTYYNGSASASAQMKNRYSNNGNDTPPSFTLTQAALSGWSARGWSASTAGNGGITYANGAAFTRNSDVTLYGMYQQAVTLSYSGNGATGGSTAAQTGYRYYNSNGQTLNASFSLRANGFTRTSYTFSKWALGSAGGTQYAAGAGVTLAASTIFYALWVGNPHTFAPNKASWAITEERGEDNGLYVYETSVVIEGRKSDGAVAYGVTAAAATIPTGGCSKLRLTTSSDFDPECTATVDGVLKYGPGELEFDVAGKSSVKVSIRLSTGSDYRKSQVTLSQIYFYN